MRTYDLGTVVDSDPPHGMCCPNQKVPKSQWRRGRKGGTHKIKSAQNYYLGIVKKFQNNEISHFLTVDFQKNGGQIWPPPRPE